MSLSRVEKEMALCWTPKTRIEIPVKDLSLTKEDAIKFELKKLMEKLSKEDSELLRDLIEKQIQFRELDFAGEYC